MTNFYISDPHFGHENIIPLCGRPFSNADEMDQTLITNFNAKVTKDDDLWIIGDFSCNRKAKDLDYLKSIFERLNGRKHLVTGNHDTKQVLELPWASVNQMVMVKDEGQLYFLCHYPMITWPQSRHGAIQLFGHIHNNWPGSRNSVNMSVELWNYSPATKTEILERAETLPVNKHWGEVEPN